MTPAVRRFAEVGGMLMAGDGLVAAINPKAHVQLWMAGPKLWQRAIRPFERSPGLRRAVGIAQVALGIAIGLAAIGAAGGTHEDMPEQPLGV